MIEAYYTQRTQICFIDFLCAQGDLFKPYTMCKICKWFPINQMQGNTGNFLQQSMKWKPID